jgi:transposase-like protein
MKRCSRPTCGRFVAFSRKQVDRRTGRVHGPVQVHPFAFDPDVPLVHRQESFVALSRLRRRRSNSGAYRWTQRQTVLVQTVEKARYPAITAGMTEPTSAQDLFKGRHFDQEIIVLCVRWYITFKLSFRDLVQMMAERGITLSHPTILRWVQQYVPEFEKRWNHYARPVGDSWRVDETYIKVKGQWVYLYRAVDKQGRTVDFLLSKRRDVAAAKRFFCRAAKQHGAPRVITLDGYAASHRAVDKLKTSGILPRRVQVRSCKYLNNVIEQDHRRIKQRVRPMLGFKRFETAAVTIRGIELAEKIKKQRFNLKPLTGKATIVPEIWAVVLAA